jgi:co-chaperonin GroES (HSP10)
MSINIPKPLGKNILLKKVEEENSLKSGIIITEAPKNNLVIEALGKDVDKIFEKGQKVVLSQYNRATVEGEFLIVNSDDIIAIK